MNLANEIKTYLQRERRRREWLASEADISISLLEKVMRGYIPRQDSVQKICNVIFKTKGNHETQT